MKALLFALSILACLSLCVQATPPYTPQFHRPHEETHHGREIRIAHVDFYLSDVYTRDIFIFSGKPTTIVATVAVTGQAGYATGQGVKATGAVGAIAREDEAMDDGTPLGGYADGAKAPTVGGDLLSRALASLKAGSCASCHGSKAKGGVTLFADDTGTKLVDKIDWSAVLAYTTAKGANPPACPQGGLGRALTAAELEPIKALAEGKR